MKPFLPSAVMPGRLSRLTALMATAVLLLLESRTREILIARPRLHRGPRREHGAG